MSSALPLEVLDDIIGRISNDIFLLRQLALLNHDFAYLCQKHLFASTAIESEESCDRLHDILEFKPGLAHIHDLRIEGQGWALLNDALLSVLEYITEAGTLRAFTLTYDGLNDISWENELKDSILCLFKSCSGLGLVRLGDFCHDGFPLECFLTIPRLDYLGFFYDHRGPYTEAGTPPSLPLDSLSHERTHYLDTFEIGNVAALSLIEVLVGPNSLISLSRLRHLVIHQSSLDLFTAVNIILRYAADSISCISWVHPSLPASSESGPIGMSACDLTSPTILFAASPSSADDIVNLRTLNQAHTMRVFISGAMNSQQIENSLQLCGIPPNVETFSVMVDPPCVFNLYFHPETSRRLDRAMERIANGRHLRSLKCFRFCVMLGVHDAALQWNRLRGINFKKLFVSTEMTGKLEIVVEEGRMDDAVTKFEVQEKHTRQIV